MKAALALAITLLSAFCGLAAAAPAQASDRICGGSRPHWVTRPGPQAFEHVVFNRLRVSRDGALLWNGSPVTRDVLREYLALVAQMEPMPVTILDPAPGVDCTLLDSIRDDTERGCAHGSMCVEGPFLRNREPLPVSDQLARELTALEASTDKLEQAVTEAEAAAGAEPR